MAATDTDSVHDHMTRLRMKMVQQKIANEKERILNRPSSEESTNNNNNHDLENQARLQQAMLRRQELLDKIRREQLLNEDGKRPRTYSARRRYTPSPLPVPPTRRSLPDFARYNYYNNPPNNPYQRPETHRPDMSQVKHVIEHKIASPRPHHLPPIRAPPPPGVIIHPPPQPQIMQAPAPQIIQAPPQHVIQQIPNPVIQNLGPPEKQSMFNKADFMDMMLMQNVQMHQVMMQKYMNQTLHPGEKDSETVPRLSPGAAVHHHHYSQPQAPPAVHHYQSMPPMDLRGGYPYREYGSAYTGPGYTYQYYDDGNNYYAYH